MKMGEVVKKQYKVSMISLFKKLFVPSFKTSPARMSFSIFLSLFQAATYGVEPMALKYLIEELSTAYTAGFVGVNLQHAIIIFVVVYAIGFMSNGLSNSYHARISYVYNKTLSHQLFKKTKKVSLYSYEDSKLLDDINNAVSGIETAEWYIMITSFILTFYIPVTISFSVFFIMVHPLLLLMFPMILIPTIFIQKLRVEKFTDVSDRSGKIRRQRDAFSTSIIDQKNFKETRQLGLASYFYDLFSKRSNDLVNLEIEAEKSLFKRESLIRIISISTYALILTFLFYLLKSGRINVASFTAVISSLGNLYEIVEEIIYRHLNDISTYAGYAKNYQNYLDMEEDVSNIKKKMTIDDGITLENLSFKYPNTETEVIKGVNLKIKKGEKIALVGNNGSGKTTLSKIILGLYPHYGGSVKYGKDEIKDYSLDSPVELSTSIFQDFNRYKFSLKENVSLSDINKDENMGEIRRGLEKFNMNPEELKEGIKTILSTEFGGQDLSKGQWQSVAMARAWYRDKELIILDEPTSAIDPEKESMIYEALEGLMKDKTCIIVTHRLGLTKIADRILVMKDGKIVEEGSHKELMAGDTHYREMYNSQLKWYKGSLNGTLVV